MTPRVVVRDLWASYPARTRRGRRAKVDRWALAGVDLTAAAGEIVGVVGPNGSGKTTLLHTINGVLTPRRGTVETTGRVAGLIDLSAGMHRELTGGENAMIAGVLSGMLRDEVRERMDEIAAFAGLGDDVFSAPLATYSSGMGLRLGFSVAVHTAPDVLLVDEVLAVGDAAFQQRCIAKVTSLVESGCAVVLVSHDLDLVVRHAARAVHLENGEVVASGPPGTVVDAYLARAAEIGASVPLARTVRRRAERSWSRRR